MANKKPHKPIHNLGAFAHPPKAQANPKMQRTHLDKPSKPATAKVVKGPAKDKPKAKAPRADFALPGGKFPLNTPGRRQVAAKDAAVAKNAGSITAAQAATVKRKAAAARKKKGT